MGPESCCTARGRAPRLRRAACVFMTGQEVGQASRRSPSKAGPRAKATRAGGLSRVHCRPRDTSPRGGLGSTGPTTHTASGDPLG